MIKLNIFGGTKQTIWFCKPMFYRNKQLVIKNIISRWFYKDKSHRYLFLNEGFCLFIYIFYMHVHVCVCHQCSVSHHTQTRFTNWNFNPQICMKHPQSTRGLWVNVLSRMKARSFLHASVTKSSSITANSAALTTMLTAKAKETGFVFTL